MYDKIITILLTIGIGVLGYLATEIKQSRADVLRLSDEIADIKSEIKIIKYHVKLVLDK